jgi:ribosome recycling factor
MSHELTQEAELQMEEVLEGLARRLSKIRTGKASPAMLDSVKVDYYGAPTPLKQLANVGAPEPRLLTVSPFDRSVLGDIEKAIQSAGLGLNPGNDGNVIRVPIPELTEDRRREMSKMAREHGEMGKVAVRKARQVTNDQIKKSDDLTEDEVRTTKDEVQKLTDSFCAEVDKLVTAKEAEIMEI